MSTPRRIGWSVLVAAALATVFAMYTQPDFMVQMANQIWSCF